MKNYSVKLARLMVLFATSAAIGMEPLYVDPSIGVYVINGGTKYAISVQSKPGMMATERGLGTFNEKTVPFGKSEYVGQLQDIVDINTSGYLAMGWTSNKETVEQIKQEAVNMNYRNAIVYVHVIWNARSGYHINRWHWAQEEAQAQSSELIALVTLQDVVNGALGQEYVKEKNPITKVDELKEVNYAKIVKEICSADYTKAKERDAVDLCVDLKKMFARGKSGGLSEEDAKRIIRSFYARLEMYKKPQGPNRIIYAK